MNPILVALDVDTPAKALALADALRGAVGGFKIGKQLFTAAGPDMVRQLNARGLPPHLMVDCSHANSGKLHARQEEVWRSLVAQRCAGNRAIIAERARVFREGVGQLPGWRIDALGTYFAYLRIPEHAADAMQAGEKLANRSLVTTLFDESLRL